MKIGILTFYKVVNFGANLQALSTYQYLKTHGYTPVMINYQSTQMNLSVLKRLQTDRQAESHLRFVDSHLRNQTKLCSTIKDVIDVLEQEKINNLIIGSDAVIQHHPVLSRIHIGRRKPIYIENIIPERLFPNPFWGIGLSPKIKIALMSASSQNSRYDLFSQSIKREMHHSLSHFSYISVRDSWTERMLFSITKEHYPITPDPVFAFNQNVADIIPTKDAVLKKYGLPDKYVLISLRSHLRVAYHHHRRQAYQHSSACDSKERGHRRVAYVLQLTH